MKRLLLVGMTCLIIPTLQAGIGAAEIGWNASGKGGAVAAGGKDSVAAGISILQKS